jgi:hypothetical protein
MGDVQAAWDEGAVMHFPAALQLCSWALSLVDALLGGQSKIDATAWTPGERYRCHPGGFPYSSAEGVRRFITAAVHGTPDLRCVPPPSHALCAACLSGNRGCDDDGVKPFISSTDCSVACNDRRFPPSRPWRQCAWHDTCRFSSLFFRCCFAIQGSRPMRRAEFPTPCDGLYSDAGRQIGSICHR